MRNGVSTPLQDSSTAEVLSTSSTAPHQSTTTTAALAGGSSVCDEYYNSLYTAMSSMTQTHRNARSKNKNSNTVYIIHVMSNFNLQIRIIITGYIIRICSHGNTKCSLFQCVRFVGQSSDVRDRVVHLLLQCGSHAVGEGAGQVIT